MFPIIKLIDYIFTYMWKIPYEINSLHLPKSMYQMLTQKILFEESGNPLLIFSFVYTFLSLYIFYTGF